MIGLVKVAKRSPVCRHVTANCYRMMATATATPSDPIHKLFVDKIREYGQKAKSAPGGLVDANDKVVQGLKEDMERVGRQYGIKDEKTLANLNLKFDAECKLDPINLVKE